MVKLRWAHQQRTWEIREQSLRGDWKTHASAQDDRVLSIVGDDDEPAGDSPRVTKETDRQTNVLAASASTFSRNWQAPPPLMQFNSASTLQTSRLISVHMDMILHLLVRPVDGDIEF